METCMRCGRQLSSDGILDDLDEKAFTLCDRCAGEQILRKGGCWHTSPPGETSADKKTKEISLLRKMLKDRCMTYQEWDDVQETLRKELGTYDLDLTPKELEKLREEGEKNAL